MPPKDWYMRIKGWFRSTGSLPRHIRLVERIKPVVENRGGFIIVIRGAYNKLVGRETQQSQDQIQVQQISSITRQLEESQSSSVQISYTKIQAEVKPLSESQGSSDALAYDTAALRTKHLEDEQASTDALTYETAHLAPILSYDESQDASDALEYETATLVTINLSESQDSSDALSTSEATRKLYRMRENQYSIEIPVAYVPQGNETLEIHVLTETQQTSDALAYSTSSVANAFNVSEWYVEYNATIALNYTEEQDSSDALTYETATLQTLDYEESQDSSDEITYSVKSIFAGITGEWYAEYQTTKVLNYTEEQDSSDALVLHKLVTTHPDTFEIGEWYAEYEVT